MLGEGALLAAGVLSAYLWAVWTGGPGPRATAIAFVAVVVIHPFQAMNCRSDRLGWWRLPPNPLVWVSLATLVAAQWVATTWSPLAGLLGAVPLAAADWLAVFVAVLWPVVLLEGAKTWWPGCPRLLRDRRGALAAHGERGRRYTNQ
jgi:hypothetical protein